MSNKETYLDRIERRDLIVAWRDGGMMRRKRLSDMCVLFEEFGADGRSSSEIADILGHPTSVRNMLSKYPELREAYQRGIDGRTIDVEAAMLKRATGFKIVTKSKSTRTVGDKVEVIEKEDEVYYPPDATIGKFILSSRERERFTDDGGNKTAVVINLDAAASRL